MFHGGRLSFSCVCHKGFSGYFCEKSDINITLSFGKEVIISPTIHIHLFRDILNHLDYSTMNYDRMSLFEKEKIEI